MHLNGIFFRKDGFLKNVEAKVIIISRYAQPNETMNINKFQRSRLTFDLSAKVARIGVPLIYLNIAFLESIKPIELKFHMKTPYDKFVKICKKNSGHMTKMADIPIYGKNPLKIFSRTRNLSTLAWGLVCDIWDVGLTKFVQMMILG